MWCTSLTWRCLCGWRECSNHWWQTFQSFQWPKPTRCGLHTIQVFKALTLDSSWTYSALWTWGLWTTMCPCKISWLSCLDWRGMRNTILRVFRDLVFLSSPYKRKFGEGQRFNPVLPFTDHLMLPWARLPWDFTRPPTWAPSSHCFSNPKPARVGPFHYLKKAF